MNSHDLSREQLDQLAEKARLLTGFLHAMKERMERRGFPVGDRLFQQTTAAFEKVHELRMSLHYLSCDKARQS